MRVNEQKPTLDNNNAMSIDVIDPLNLTFQFCVISMCQIN
jgi:hypothetical protein